MEEDEIDALVMPWVNARVSHLLLVHRMTAIEVGDDTTEESNSDDYDQVISTQKVETIMAFCSHVVPVNVGRAYTGEHTNIMVQALWMEDGRWLFATRPYCTKYIHRAEVRK